jgi:hypothetical protein
MPSLASLIIYSLKTFADPLFESITPVVIPIIVVLLGITYFKMVNSNFLKQGL